MNNETIVALGWLTGQFVVTAVAVKISQKENMTYQQAARVYFQKEIGNFVIGIAGLCLLLFIFPDFWDANINKMDLKIQSTKTWKEWIMIYQRVTAACVGGFIQIILIVVYKKGEKAVEKLSDKIG